MTKSTLTSADSLASPFDQQFDDWVAILESQQSLVTDAKITRMQNFGQSGRQLLPIFVYGSLACPDVLARILDLPFPKRLARMMTPAELDNHTTLKVRGTDVIAAVDLTNIVGGAPEESCHKREQLQAVLGARLAMHSLAREAPQHDKVAEWFEGGQPSCRSKRHGSRDILKGIASQGASRPGQETKQSGDELYVRGFLVYGLSWREKCILDKFCGKMFEARSES